ncbi:sigma factor-like helix-turn-helix DNA-binding protein [Amycolatopsis sp. NPDC051758]|uniref:sigma factor-like helix-turn-helix DNA-binding protein n=1 Tax=Amycolatopsis sp. NPDC051758 TaxID=3363935 RepID=UPI00379EC77A
MLSRKRRPVTFDAAVEEALLLDAMLLLPPRQRFAVRSVVTRNWSVTDIAAHTGWTRGQVHNLLRAGLKTLSEQGGSAAAPS